MRAWLLLGFLCAGLQQAAAYDLITRRGLRWPDGDVPVKLQLDATLETFPLLDGKTSWNEVAQEALAAWNRPSSRVRFTSTTGGTRGDGNDENEVFFSDDIYGQRFGRYVLAVTTAWRVGSRRVEADTIFNRALFWNSYRGQADFHEIDLRRVAAHEFGHILGLDHPDEAGQVRVAIMNSSISDLDDLALDDLHGVRALYPPATNYALAVAVLPPGAGTVAVSPPPDADGRYPAGTMVTLTTRPARRHRFNHWSGDHVSSARRVRVRMVDDLTVTASFSTNGAPVARVHPRSQHASAYDRVELRSGFRGATGLQWARDGQEIPGATNAALVLNFVGHEHSGLYTARATNAHGATVTKPARLVVEGY